MKAEITFVPFSVTRHSAVFDTSKEIECIKRQNECMDNVAKLSTQCGLDCQALQPAEEAVKCINECSRLHDLAVADCARRYRICRGLPPDPPDLPQRFTQNQKDRFSAAGNGFISFGGSISAAGLGIFGVALFAPEPKPWAIGLGLGVTAIGFGCVVLAGRTLDKIDDPVDKNFKKKALPKPPKPPLIKPVPGLNQEVADAVNEVLENQARVVGIDRALMTSINRAQGATVAKEHDFEEMQLKTAREYAGQVAKLIGQSASLRSTATDKLRSSEIIVAASDDQAREMRNTVIDNGIPEQIHNIVQAYGSNRHERDDIEGRFIMSLFDINALKAPFPDSMTPEGLSSAEQEIESALMEFANSTS